MADEPKSGEADSTLEERMKVARETSMSVMEASLRQQVEILKGQLAVEVEARRSDAQQMEAFVLRQQYYKDEVKFLREIVTNLSKSKVIVHTDGSDY